MRNRLIPMSARPGMALMVSTLRYNARLFFGGADAEVVPTGVPLTDVGDAVGIHQREDLRL